MISFRKLPEEMIWKANMMKTIFFTGSQGTLFNTKSVLLTTVLFKNRNQKPKNRGENMFNHWLLLFNACDINTKIPLQKGY
jgi:hypothetical protein